MSAKQEPDTPLPDDAAIEERVRRMMDITVPDDVSGDDILAQALGTSPVPISTPPKPQADTPKPLPILVDEEEESEVVPAVSTEPEPTAPLINSGKPKLEPSSVKKSIVIKHFNDAPTETVAPEPEPEPEVVEEPAPEPVKPSPKKQTAAKPKPTPKPKAKKAVPITMADPEPEVILPPAANPLIPSDKLAIAIGEGPTVLATPEPEVKPAKAPKAKPAAKKATKAKPPKKTTIAVSESEPEAEPAAPVPESKPEKTLPIAIKISEPEPEQPKEEEPTPEPELVNEPEPELEPEQESEPEAEDLPANPPAPVPFPVDDDEIAAAFEPAEDELDELAAEPTPSETPEKIVPAKPIIAPRPMLDIRKPEPTAPELPAEKPAQEAPEPAPKPKFDKFKPLTDIRPQRPAGEIKSSTLNLEDKATSKAVEDIQFKEADTLLTAMPGVAPAIRPAPTPTIITKPKHKKVNKAKRAKALRRLTVAIAILLLVVVAAIPTSRNAVLAFAHVRTGATITVYDQSTGQPLKDVTLTSGSKTATTNAQGIAQFGGLNLGTTQVTATRKAYRSETFTARLGFGKNTLPTLNMVPTGAQHKLIVIDYVTGKPVKALLDSPQGSALADGSGLIKLSVDKSQTKVFTATISANGYRSDRLTIDPAQLDHGKLKLVIARKHAYVANDGGTLNVYAVDLDGENVKQVLKGTGSEDVATTSLVNSLTDDVAALVSVRSKSKSSDGSPISSLTLIDLRSGQATDLGKAAQTQVIGWNGEQLTYTQILVDSKPTDANRQQLLSYNYKTKKLTTLATANYFNNVLEAGGKVFYAPSSAYQPAGSVGFFQVNPDGSGKSAILPLETWNVYRTSFDHLSLSVQQDWYDFKIGDKQASKLDGPPENLDNIQYAESPDGQQGIWVEGSGSQATLKIQGRSGKSNQLVTEAGLSYPLRWVNNNTLIYRVKTAQETADFVYSTDGGAPQRVQDVEDANAITAWQIH